MTSGPQWVIAYSAGGYSSDEEDEGPTLALYDSSGAFTKFHDLNRAGARALTEYAFANGAASVRHDYDLRLTDY